MSDPSQSIVFILRDKNKYVPSFGLARRGGIRRKAKRPTGESSGVEDMATFVGHPVAVILIREDDLYSAPNRAFSKKSVRKYETGRLWVKYNTHACR
jgi:hypothetical protein